MTFDKFLFREIYQVWNSLSYNKASFGRITQFNVESDVLAPK